jgi:UDP-N-acetylmuramyl pentapeptide phosphotransferase/UDP-N-acetylglucosamine-1-phosphate transferase
VSSLVPFGGKGMIESLRTVRRRWRSFKSNLFYFLYILTAAFVAPLEINFHDFLVPFFLLARCFYCILLVHLGCVFIF